MRPVCKLVIPNSPSRPDAVYVVGFFYFPLPNLYICIKKNFFN